MRSKTLLVLGAGVHQVPLIRRAVECGCRVVTADYLPGNVGHGLSHESVVVSTVDASGVLGHARRLGIDGVVTVGSDVAVPTVAAVAAALGLPGSSPAVASTLVDKGRFRALQHRHGLPAPRHAVVTDAAEACAAAGRLAAPLVCKPPDTSGSRGITLVAEPEPALLAEAFALAARYSRGGTVCLEEYVEGQDVSGDGFLADGRLTAAVMTSKRTRGFVVAGHALPTHLDAGEQRRVARAVEVAAAAAGYRDGAVDFDVRLASDRAVVIEMSPRLGGNGIPALAGHGTGADLLGAAVRTALGDAPELPGQTRVHSPCGSLLLSSPATGKLVSIADPDRVRQAVGELFDLSLACAPGDRVEAHTHGGASLGIALFDIPPQATWEHVAGRVGAALSVTVEDGQGA